LDRRGRTSISISRIEAVKEPDGGSGDSGSGDSGSGDGVVVVVVGAGAGGADSVVTVLDVSAPVVPSIVVEATSGAVVVVVVVVVVGSSEVVVSEPASSALVTASPGDSEARDVDGDEAQADTTNAVAKAAHVTRSRVRCITA